MEIGKTLKEARLARGLTLEAVEEETKIRRKYIQAMEEEQFQILPGAVYAKAFLKNYAKYLNVNIEEALETFGRQNIEDTLTEEIEKPADEEQASNDTHSRPHFWLYISAALLVAVLAVFFYQGAKGQWLNRPAERIKNELNNAKMFTPQPEGQTQPPGNQQEPPAKGNAEETPGVQLVLNVKDKRCWMRVVMDDSASTAYEGILTAGQSKDFQAKDKIYVKLGDAGVVEVQVNGQNRGFLGGPGDVVEQVFKSSQRS